MAERSENPALSLVKCKRRGSSAEANDEGSVSCLSSKPELMGKPKAGG